MIAKIYLICGIVFEFFILKSYFENNDPYTIAEILIGAVIDIIAWPIILLENIIE